MRKFAWAVVWAAAAVSGGCGTDSKKSGNNETSNNGGSTNGGGSNNRGSNNGGSNNGGTTNNQTPSTNNQTPSTNNSPTVGPYGSCDEGELTACFYNADCAQTERCEDVGDGSLEVACCVPGARGEKAVGEGCASENECDSGLCVQRNDDPYICSQPCGGPDDCPETLECHGALGLCVTM